MSSPTLMCSLLQDMHIPDFSRISWGFWILCPLYYFRRSPHPPILSPPHIPKRPWRGKAEAGGQTITTNKRFHRHSLRFMPWIPGVSIETRAFFLSLCPCHPQQPTPWIVKAGIGGQTITAYDSKGFLQSDGYRLSTLPIPLPLPFPFPSHAHHSSADV